MRRACKAPRRDIASSHANIATIQLKKGDTDTALISLGRAYKTVRQALPETGVQVACVLMCEKEGEAVVLCLREGVERDWWIGVLLLRIQSFPVNHFPVPSLHHVLALLLAIRPSFWVSR